MKSKTKIALFIFLIISQRNLFGKNQDTPKVQAKEIEILYSEKAKIKAKIAAKKANTFENNDMKFDNGVFVEFFDEKKKVKATLKASQVKYIDKDNIYEMYEGVEVINNETKEILRTDELYWNPDEKKIYTERVVKIITEDISLLGKGLDAKEDLSEYTILEPKGTIKIKKKDKKEAHEENNAEEENNIEEEEEEEA